MAKIFAILGSSAALCAVILLGQNAYVHDSIWLWVPTYVVAVVFTWSIYPTLFYVKR